MAKVIYRCPKCNVKISEEKWVRLETICMSGNCPIEEMDDKNNCALCEATIKERVLDALE